MTGKFIAALVAAGFSTASAATVSVVYTTIILPHHVDAPAPPSEVAFSGGAKTAVVLNATNGYFDSVKDSSADGDGGPACSGADALQHCVVVTRASDVRLKILGYTLTLPPIWLGGDSEDAYSANGTNDASPSFYGFEGLGVVVRLGRRHEAGGLLSSGPPAPGTDGQSGPQSQNGESNSGTDSPQTPVDSAGGAQTAASSVGTSSVGTSPLQVTGGFLREPGSARSEPLPMLVSDALGQTSASPSSDLTGSDPFSASPDSSPYPDPATIAIGGQRATSGELGVGGPATPEASTWVMTIAGFAALGLLQRRRFATALKAVKG